MFGGPSFGPGSIIRFSYYVPNTTDPHKEVLVLHPNWQGHLHAIDLKRLTPAEREVLHAIMDPQTQRPHRIPLVNDVLQRMTPWEEIKNPTVFYSRFVKVFLRNKDAYRRYMPHRMTGIQVLQPTPVQASPNEQGEQQPHQTTPTGTTSTSKPLFKKV